MAISFNKNKKDLEKKKQSKKLEKQKRKEERKMNGGSKSFEDMIAYVNEDGVITSNPPDPQKRQEIDLEDIVISTPKKEEVEEPVLQGRVEYFNEEKGYGFIKDLNSINKYFFHISSAPASIAEGNMVSFELERGTKGMHAVNVTLKK